MKVLVIEDELRTANDLIRTLQIIDQKIEVVKHAFSVKESVEYLVTKPTLDLIFSDIKLGDGSSFEIFDTLQVNVPVIFCTAYDEFALEAFRANGIDYILKPFSNSTVERALEKYYRLTNIESESSKLKSVANLMMNKSVSKPKTLLVHLGDKIIPLKVADIVMFYVEDKYSFAHTESGKRYLLSYTLEELNTLFSNEYYRVNRQYIVKRSAIKEVIHQPNRKLKLLLNAVSNHEILVGKLKMTHFLDWLEQ